MKTKCYSVRLRSMERISPKAYKAVGFDGTSDIIPASQVIGPDFEVEKSDAYWISAWILEKKHLTYSRKKVAWFDEDLNRVPMMNVETHTPEEVKVVTNDNVIEELIREHGTER